MPTTATACSPPRLESSDAAVIARELAARGVRYERWPAPVALPAGADQETILAAYAGEIARVQAEGRYRTVDAIRLGPDHPERQALRAKFLAEHTHSEDEVRFFVEGRGLFCLPPRRRGAAAAGRAGRLDRGARRHPPLVRHRRAPRLLRPALLRQQRGLGGPLHR